MPVEYHYSVGTGTITDSKTVIAIGAPATTGATAVEIFTDPGRFSAEAIPDRCYLEKLEVELNTPANSPVNVIWNLAKDAAGDYPLTPEVTSPILYGVAHPASGGAAALGGFNETIECKRIRTYLAVAGFVYLVSRMSVATSTMVAKVLLGWRY